MVLLVHETPMGGSPEQAFQRAFTLIEVLVVIAVMAVMAGLLLPMLGRAKQRAYLVTDVNNTRQILVATHLYAGDYNDFLPHPGWVLPYACWAYGYPFPYSGGTDAGYELSYAGQVAAVAQGQLYPYFKEAKLLMCPGDQVNDLFLQRQMYISSYVWNGAVTAYDRTTDQTFKLGQFKGSAILQWEADETRPQTLNDGADFPYDGFTRRHGGGGNPDRTKETGAMCTIGRFDGSSSRASVPELYQLADGWGLFPNGPTPGSNDPPTDLWCNPNRANGGPGVF